MHKITAIPNRPPVPILKIYDPLTQDINNAETLTIPRSDYNPNSPLLIECMEDINYLMSCQNLTAKTLAIETLTFSSEPEIDRLIHLLCKLNTDTLIIASEGDPLFDAFERQQYFFDQLIEKNKTLGIQEINSLWVTPQPEKRPPIQFPEEPPAIQIPKELGSFLLLCIIHWLISNLLNSSDNEY